jgi:hypothetical protein
LGGARGVLSQQGDRPGVPAPFFAPSDAGWGGPTQSAPRLRGWLPQSFAAGFGRPRTLDAAAERDPATSGHRPPAVSAPAVEKRRLTLRRPIFAEQITIDCWEHPIAHQTRRAACKNSCGSEGGSACAALVST